MERSDGSAASKQHFALWCISTGRACWKLPDLLLMLCYSSLKMVSHVSAECKNVYAIVCIEEPAARPQNPHAWFKFDLPNWRHRQHPEPLLPLTLKLIWVSICCQSDLPGQTICSDLHIKSDLFSTFCRVHGEHTQKTHITGVSGFERYIKRVYLNR